MPQIDDSRFMLVKGLIQNTLTSFLSKNKKIFTRALIVHFDTDAYNATTYSLFKLHSSNQEYFAIFDEFYGDEMRALHDFKISTWAILNFIFMTPDYNGYPFKVIVKIQSVSDYRI